MAEQGFKRGFPLVSTSNPDKVVCITQVKLREPSFDQGQGVLVNHNVIQDPKVNAGSQQPILIFYEEEPPLRDEEGPIKPDDNGVH